MTNETPIKFPEWKELADAAREWEYDGIYSHATIAEIMRLEPQTARYFQMVNRAKAEIRTHKKHLVAVHGVGYRVIRPDEHVKAASEQAKLAHRRLECGAAILAATNLKALTDEQRQQHRAVADRMLLAKTFIVGNSDEQQNIAIGISGK